jgi:hypothetical protein
MYLAPSTNPLFSPPAMSQVFGLVYYDADFRGSPQMMRSEMVLETSLFYSSFNPMMQVLAQYFTEFSYTQSFKL